MMRLLQRIRRKALATTTAVALVAATLVPLAAGSASAADIPVTPPAGGYTSVPVGGLWADNNGKHIQAHGGGFLQHDGWYYWIGENKALGGAQFRKISLYRSKDLVNWTFVHDVLTGTTPNICKTGSYKGGAGGIVCTIERPKLVYNAVSGKFVIWAHWENGSDYASSHLLVATSDTIDGDYQVVRNFRPGAGAVATDEEDPTCTVKKQPGEAHPRCGYGSRDFTVYQDPDSEDAYLVSAQDHLSMRVYKLSWDYTDVDWQHSYPLFVEQRREAPALFKVGSRYYAITSSQSGWMPNQASYSYTDDITNPDGWSSQHLLGNNTTWYSQPTNVMVLTAADGHREYVYMGDRWNPTSLGDSRYVWLPLEVDGTNLTLDYTPGWSLNADGGIQYPGVELVSQGKPATGTATRHADCATATYSCEPSAANDGKVQYDDWWNDTARGDLFRPADAPFFWQVDLGAPKDLSRIDLSFLEVNGSEGYAQYTVSGSSSASGPWTQLYDASANKSVSFYSNPISGSYRYVRVDVSAVKNASTNDPGATNQSVASWGTGLVEAQVYAKAAELPSGLEVTSLPTKKVYTVGETFDPSGLTARATYPTAPATSAPYADLAFSQPDLSTPGEKTVTVTYKGRRATFAIAVIAATAVTTTDVVADDPGATVTDDGSTRTVQLTRDYLVEDVDLGTTATPGYTVQVRNAAGEWVSTSAVEVAAGTRTVAIDPVITDGLRIVLASGSAATVLGSGVVIGGRHLPDSAVTDLKELHVGAIPLPGFQPSRTSYTVGAPVAGLPAVVAVAADRHATVSVTQPTAATPSATAVVTAQSGATKTYTVTFKDEVPPTLSASVSPAAPDGENGWYRTTPSVTLTASDNVGAPVTTYSLGAQGAHTYTAPVGLPEGVTTLTASTKDSAGNESEVVSSEYRVDTVAPVVAPSVSAARVLSVTASDANLSGVQYAVGGGAWAEYQGPVPLGDAATTVQARATDAAGNVATSAPVAVGKKSVAPVAPPRPTVPVPAGVVRVKAAQASVTVVRGKSVKVPAFAYTADGSRVKVTYKSSKAKVAKVTKAGKITGKKVGKAKVTVKAANGKKVTVKVRVVAKKAAKAKVTKVTVKVPSSLRAGQVVWVTARFAPASAAGAVVSYRSSKPGVVSVDKAGRLVAKARGKAQLVVKVGKKTKKIALTVR